MSLKLLVQLLEDEPWCGTKPRPPHPHADALSAAVAPAYATRVAVAAAHDAVRLHQIGHIAGGAVKEMLSEGAAVLFDEYCGSIPLTELIQLLLHQPPPPPSPWVVLAENLVAQYTVEALTERDQKLEKPHGKTKTIVELIKESLWWRITGGGATGSGGPSTVLPLPSPPVPVLHFPADEVRKWLREQAARR